VIGLVVLIGLSIAGYLSQIENRPIDVNQLRQSDSRSSLEGKTRTVRGELLFAPASDFQYNALYLMDPETPGEYRSPEYGFWFGIRIDGALCTMDEEKEIVTCAPFNPTLPTTYEFKGTIHIESVGKKDVMWLSDIDFEKSRQMVNGKWLPIPLGEYTFPIEAP
jgi:hypothetical protein